MEDMKTENQRKKLFKFVAFIGLKNSDFISIIYLIQYKIFLRPKRLLLLLPYAISFKLHSRFTFKSNAIADVYEVIMLSIFKPTCY